MFADGVMEASSSTGTDDYVLTGPVYNGMTVNQRFNDGDPVAFIAQTLNRSNYEIIAGVYEEGPPRKLIRSTVLASSAGGAKINWQPEDVYYIATYASADALSGACNGNFFESMPWWVKFGLWIKKNFPITDIHQWNFHDGSADIPFAKIDSATHVVTLDLRVFPAGLRFGYAGTTAPTGSLLEEGQSLLRTSYAPLFTAIGTTWGAADSTHFNVPNSKGRVDVGRDSADAAFDTIGETGGAKTASSGVEVAVTGQTIAGATDVAYGSHGILGSGPATGTHQHTIPALDLDLDVVVTTPTFGILMPYIVGPKIITINQ